MFYRILNTTLLSKRNFEISFPFQCLREIWNYKNAKVTKEQDLTLIGVETFKGNILLK